MSWEKRFVLLLVLSFYPLFFSFYCWLSIQDPVVGSKLAAFLGEFSNDDVEAYTQRRHFVLSVLSQEG